ncbi:MAG: DUF721 domain-containing protein [Bacteroidales bacterium]|nr:DUF721 domain-containing protein [Bacteroidales bacterium]
MNQNKRLFEEDYIKPRGLSEASEQPIINVMERFLSSLGVPTDFNEEEIIKVWEEITGDLIKKLTKKIYVYDKVLFVYVNAPALRSELMMVRGNICEKINNHFGKKVLKHIEIK